MTYQLTYLSEPFPWINIADIHDILHTSRRFNSENDITGCLIYTKKIFIQLLEGDQDIIDPLYQRIEKDKRHFNVEVLYTSNTDKRIFSKWAMAYLSLEEDHTNSIIKKIRHNLTLLNEGASFMEIDINQFWCDVHEVLKHAGYYPNSTDDPV